MEGVGCGSGKGVGYVYVCVCVHVCVCACVHKTMTWSKHTNHWTSPRFVLKHTCTLTCCLRGLTSSGPINSRFCRKGIKHSWSRCLSSNSSHTISGTYGNVGGMGMSSVFLSCGCPSLQREWLLYAFTVSEVKEPIR